MDKHTTGHCIQLHNQIPIETLHFRLPTLIEKLPRQRKFERVTPYFARFCRFCDSNREIFRQVFLEPETAKAILFVFSLNSLWLTDVFRKYWHRILTLKDVKEFLIALYPHLKQYWVLRRVSGLRNIRGIKNNFPWAYASFAVHQHCWELENYMRNQNKFSYRAYAILKLFMF